MARLYLLEGGDQTHEKNKQGASQRTVKPNTVSHPNERKRHPPLPPLSPRTKGRAEV